MSNYSAVLNNGLRFNLKAQTLDQAAQKTADFLLGFEDLKNEGWTVYAGIIEGNKKMHYLTITKGLYGRYKVNPNTNKKLIAICKTY